LDQNVWQHTTRSISPSKSHSPQLSPVGHSPISISHLTRTISLLRGWETRKWRGKKPFPRHYCRSSCGSALEKDVLQSHAKKGWEMCQTISPKLRSFCFRAFSNFSLSLALCLSSLRKSLATLVFSFLLPSSSFGSTLSRLPSFVNLWARLCWRRSPPPPPPPQ
jgi:hypothetical protein